VTLKPDDLIFTGTSGRPAQIKNGDAVEVEIDGIGILSNLVEEEKK
jgi:2-keto-4-pentenoate hydratase/2-oxohepta-3-ene-1,7-dioic acid hydratase in catechol pathway